MFTIWGRMGPRFAPIKATIIILNLQGEVIREAKAKRGQNEKDDKVLPKTIFKKKHSH